MAKNLHIMFLNNFFAIIIVFLLSTLILNKYIKAKLESGLFFMNIKDTKEKISKIIKEGYSIIDDIKPRTSGKLLSFIFLYLVGGTSTFFIFTFLIYGLIKNLQPSIEIIYLFITFLAIYILQDSPRMDYLEKMKTRHSRYIFNIVEMYVIENTGRKLLSRGLMNFLFKITYRVLTPIYYPEPIDIKFDSIFVYRNPEIFRFLRNLSDIKLYREDGLDLELLNTVNKCEKATVLVEKSSIEVFPYLFDPHYKYDDSGNKKWSFFRILKKEKDKSKIVGCMLVHCFKTIKVKSMIKNMSRIKKNYKSEIALLFMIFGKSEIVEYIKTEIDLMSVSVPNEVINMELAP